MRARWEKCSLMGCKVGWSVAQVQLVMRQCFQRAQHASLKVRVVMFVHVRSVNSSFVLDKGSSKKLN